VRPAPWYLRLGLLVGGALLGGALLLVGAVAGYVRARSRSEER